MAAGQPLFWVRLTRLPAETKTEELVALLPVCASLQKIALWPDRRSAEGQKYALLALAVQSEAQEVVSWLHERPFGNGSLAASHFNPLTEEREDATIHVKGLPPGISAEALQAAFLPLGAILSVQVGLTDSPGAPGFGFVQFESPETASQAVAKGSAWVEGREVWVESYLPKQERRVVTLSSVYVRGFGADYSETALKSLFSRFGEVHSCSILRNPRIFGFVNFYHQPAAAQAVSELNGVTLEGITWVVSPQVDRRKAARRRHVQEEEWSQRNLFVGGLPPFITEDMVRRLFANYGELESVRVQSRASYSFEENAVLQQELSSAYICFRLVEDADRALAAAQDLLIEGCKVYANKWKPLEARKPAVLSPQLAPWIAPPLPSGPKVKSKSKPKRTPKPLPKAAFDLALYRTLSIDKRKALLGEFIYWQLHPFHKQLAGKLTGMILEIPEAELLQLVQEPKALLDKAVEAVSIWKQHLARIPTEK